MTSSVLRLEHPSECALDTVLDFGDEALVGDAFYIFAGTFQTHAIRLVHKAAALTAIGQRLHVFDLHQARPNLRQVIRIDIVEDLLHRRIDGDASF
jgi:hypothetical protein